jgi:hypothetical protein
MTVSKYERYVVRKPLRAAAYPEVKGRQAPMIYLSNKQVPEADYYVELCWVYGIPEGDPQSAEQVLDHDQILFHIGMDYLTPQVLGGTVEFYLGGQPIVFNTTTAVFIPKGTSYGPLTYKEFQSPHVQLSIVLGSGDPYAGVDRAGAAGVKGAVPKKTQDVDYEQYVVRSPMREAGPDYIEGRQNPTMTYMSGTQVLGVKNYVEFGWIWDVPSSPLPKMRHDNYDELVLHFGSDPEAPEDLGATMQFGVGEDTLEFDSTYCVFVPKTLEHGPLIWKEVRRPMIELAMMLGAGKWADGWEGSFFDLP